MWLAADDVTRSLRGSWRLMTKGADALRELDLTRRGFWVSFGAMVLLLPATVALLAAERTGAGLSNAGRLFEAPGLLAQVAGAECLAIIVVPLLLVGLRPQLAQAPRFTSFVIAWNWAGVLSVSLMAVPATLFAIGWSFPELALLQAAAFAVIVLRLRYCVARATFGAGRVAAAIVTMSVLADYAILRLFSLAGL